MKADSIKIGELFHNRYPFCVPKYQRAYAWDTLENRDSSKEIVDFIDDLYSCWECRHHEKPRTHFFGGIVSIQEVTPKTPHGQSFEIVDGQQRLATFTILFSLIIKAYQEISNTEKSAGNEKAAKTYDELADELNLSYLKYKHLESEEDSFTIDPRLKLSKVDDLAFRELIEKGVIKGKKRESHHRVSRAYEAIRNDLVEKIRQQGKSSVEQVKLLRELVTTATADCYVIHIITEKKDEAYRLFQVLNDRGIGLTEGDLLRSYTLELLENFLQIKKEQRSYGLI